MAIPSMDLSMANRDLFPWPIETYSRPIKMAAELLSMSDESGSHLTGNTGGGLVSFQM